MKKGLLFVFLGALVCLSVPVVRAEDPLLKIRALPDQTSVKTGMMFLVRAQVLNSSSDTSTGFWANTCSFEKHWVTDASRVFIQSWTCDENALEEVSLEPGEIYEKNIILYITQKEKTEPVTFRLGFKRMSENGDVAEPLWSDPVTMQVIVPEERIEDASAVAVEPQTQDPDAIVPEDAVAETVPFAAQTEAPVSTVDQPLTFQDPGVPLKVVTGDEFSIALASNPSTGFRWKMTLPKEDRTVLFLGSEHVVSGDVMPGVPGTEVFKFRAASPGETKADFVYIRPWETITAPARKIFTIVVRES